MLTSIFLGLSLAAATPATTFEIRDIQTESHFAGKYGRRITETLVVRQGNRDVTIVIAGSAHTRFLSAGQRFEVGGRVRLSLRGTARATADSKITLDRSEVSRVR